MITGARGFLALLLVCAILIGPATCQRQGESQGARWSTTSSRQSPSNLVYRTNNRQDDNKSKILSQIQQQQQQQQQQSSIRNQQDSSIEYYEDEYYDDDEPIPSVPVAPVVSTTTLSSREPKLSKGQPAPVLYDDAYYYDDEYEDVGNSQETVSNVKEVTGSKSTDKSAVHFTDKEGENTEPVSKTINNESQEIKSISSSNNETVSTTTSTSTPSATTSTNKKSIEEEEEEEEELTEKTRNKSIFIGEEIVSVVTTKSVVNGTYSVPDFTTQSPPTSTMTQESISSTFTTPTTSSTTPSTTTSTTPSTTTSTTTTTTTTTTTEASTTSSSTTEFYPSSTIQASVQTSRSVSGARFLPFPSVIDINKQSQQEQQQQQQKQKEQEQQEQQQKDQPQQQSEQPDSTESIIDKLDRVQSELSSGFLAQNRFTPRRYQKKPFSTTSLILPPTSTIAPTSSPIPPITITAITKRPKAQTTLDDISALLPKDFAKSNTRTTTNTPIITKRPKIQTTLDDVESFLPKDFPRKTYGSSTTTKRPKLQTTLDDLDGFLPKDYPKSGYRNSYKRPSYKTSTTSSSSTTQSTTLSTTIKTEKPSSSTEKIVDSTSKKTPTTIDDISAFLPPGYKLKKEDTTTEKSSILSEILAKTKITETKNSPSSIVEVTTSTTEKTKTIQEIFAKSAIDAALLPPGYKNEASSSTPSDNKEAGGDPIQELLAKSSVDISALLPPGYKPDTVKSTKSIKSSESSQQQELPVNNESSSDKNATGGNLKIVFPSRPGGRKPSVPKITTPSSVGGGAAGPSTPSIKKGWPTRVTTEFTGWPTSSTTPISIEKLLEAARTATVSSSDTSFIPTSEITSSSSSTTTTTTTTLRPTTPGLCDGDCEVAGTIRIVENAIWVPELLDRNTREWQDLAEEIEREMNLVFAKSPVLRKWFRNIRIDSFSQGSVLVDYFVELADLKEKINTQQLKVIFHDSLRTFNYDNPMEATPKGPMKLGKFTIDPKSTDFVVIPRVASPKLSVDENRLIPQWAIAVIVVGVGGLLFIIVFGVSVLVNRQNGSKLKPSLSAMYDESMTKNMMGHHSSAAPTPSRPAAVDYQKHHDTHAMWSDVGWDKPFESTSHKILVDGLPYERKYNPYDSWKSEWNGYYYPPTHASGSNFSRHHPDYDINF